VHTVSGARLLITTDPETRGVIAINAGQPVLDWPRSAPQKYSKCAYSTRFAFTVPVSGAATATEGGIDGVISLSDDGRFFRAREQCFDAEVDDGVAFSRWKPWPGVEVETWLLAEVTGHIRVHRMKTSRKLWAIEAGFAVPYTDKATRQMHPSGESGPQVCAPAGTSLMRILFGERTPDCVDVDANSHLLASLSAMPVLRTIHEPGEHWLACWVGGSAGADDGFEDAKGYSIDFVAGGARVQRDNAPWWISIHSACGESSSARIEMLTRMG
jgi:hypothetical protein